MFVFGANSLGAMQIIEDTNQGTSIYNALQISLNRRLSKGFSALVNYTWSRSIDENSGDTTAFTSQSQTSPNNSGSVIPFEQERGPSDFDVRRALRPAVTYRIPAPFENKILKYLVGGWSVDPLVRAYSGPISGSYYLVADDPANFYAVMRPDVVAGGALLGDRS